MALRIRSGRNSDSRKARLQTTADSAPPTAVVAARPLAAAPHAQPTQANVEQPELLGEVLIEEVSIDGMCGVY